MTTAVVSGGGTGIGLAVARRLAGRGLEVTVLGRRPDVLADAARQTGATPVVCDVADPAAVAAALDALPAEVGVLVNNAGGNTDLDGPEPPPGDLAALAAAWQDNLRSNLISAVLLTAALAPRLADGGRVVTLGSIAARTGAGSYGAAKAAVEAWTIDVARELGPRGISANVVSPGLTVATEFFRGRLSAERTGQLVAATATGRAGTPDDVAALIDFLAGPDAGHITGQVLHVNGGAHLGR
ncbi:MAG TPA: SDR family oxidoreductase [Mycobacteriales bacterium]